MPPKQILLDMYDPAAVVILCHQPEHPYQHVAIATWLTSVVVDRSSLLFIVHRCCSSIIATPFTNMLHRNMIQSGQRLHLAVATRCSMNNIDR